MINPPIVLNEFYDLLIGIAIKNNGIFISVIEAVTLHMAQHNTAIGHILNIVYCVKRLICFEIRHIKFQLTIFKGMLAPHDKGFKAISIIAGPGVTHLPARKKLQSQFYALRIFSFYNRAPSRPLREHSIILADRNIYNSTDVGKHHPAAHHIDKRIEYHLLSFMFDGDHGTWFIT